MHVSLVENPCDEKDMVIGVTGSFGSGKTTVARMFAKLGAYYIDADRVYHSLLRHDSAMRKKIIKHFGETVTMSAGKIDTKKLAKIVFSDRAKLDLLNRLTHPAIKNKIKDMIRAEKTRDIVLEAPLLIESRFYREADIVIVIEGREKEDALMRTRMQMPLNKKLAFADFIIDNSGTREKTFSQVREIWKKRGE
ncbi:MAG: dephospho-CoA kinase [Candidatus Omnitrophota bacterium]|nr:dephospho-CoA kinase [Candidatus Omnitrophota bacterium]